VLLAGALAGTAWWAAGGTHRPAAPAPAVVARPAVTAAAPVVPVGFAGSWGGQVAQPAGARHTFPVRLRLPDGAAGGDLSLPSLGCTARVDVVAPAGGPGLALVQRTTADPRHRCAPSARITLTPVGDGTLAFAWQDTRDLANTATATLART